MLLFLVCRLTVLGYSSEYEAYLTKFKKKLILTVDVCSF